MVTLLKYDGPDLRAEDEVSLKEKKGELYCYMFETSCMAGRKGRSVYEKLSTARQLEIKVIDGGKSPHDGNRYAMLLFYDKALISESLLQSQEFLCREAINKIASWKFKMVEGNWVPVTPLFDNETIRFVQNDRIEPDNLCRLRHRRGIPRSHTTVLFRRGCLPLPREQNNRRRVKPTSS